MELFSGFTEKARRTLLDYNWPGNIRELKNVVERAVYRSNNPHIPVHKIVLDPFESDFRPTGRIKTVDRISSPNPASEPLNNSEASTNGSTTEEQAILTNVAPLTFPIDLKTLSQEYEIELIKKALSESHFNQRRTAEKLNLTYHQLRGYLKKYSLLDGQSEEETE
jgi:psp operon transcriptional activator